MAYKSVNRAYNRLYENYTTPTPTPPGMNDFVEQNYKKGGGFGYICVSNDTSVLNHDDASSVTCHHTFVSPDLIPDDITAITKTHTPTGGTATDTFYVVHKNTTKTQTKSLHDAGSYITGPPAQTWVQFTQDKTTCGAEPTGKGYKTGKNANSVVPIATKDTDCFNNVCGAPGTKSFKSGKDATSVIPATQTRGAHCFE